MSKILLTETYGIKLQLTEDKAQGRVVARGQFGKADIPTANRRIYPRNLWEREFQKLLPKMRDNQIYGELDHPGDGQTKLRRVSHLVTNAEIQDDGIIIGEAIILPSTDNGKQLLGILRDGGKVGISSRGYGSVQPNEEGMDVVQDDFQLMTWDFVADPAATGSYPEFTAESKQYEPKVMIKEVEDMKIDKTKIKTEALHTEDAPGEEQDVKQSEPDKEVPVKNEDEDGPEQNPVLDKDEDMGFVDVPKDKVEALIAKIRKEESEKAVGKLQEMIKEKENEIREAIRSELESDPTVAGARLAMESVKQTLRPFILGEDISEELGVRERALGEANKNVAALTEQLQQYENITKELGYKLRIEQKIADLPYKSEIRRLMGDVTRFESLKTLDTKLEGVLGQIKAYQNRFEAKEKEKDVVIKGLEEQNASLKKMYKEAIKVAENFGIKAYMEQRLSGHPASERIKKIVESRNLTKTEDVDALVEQFNTLKTNGSALRDRIKKRLSLAKKSETLVEDQITATRPVHRSEELLPGLTIDDIKRLSE